MMRISQATLLRAIARVKSMDEADKGQLSQEIQRDQPHLFDSCLVQAKLGVPVEKIAFLLHLLFVCFQAMKESGLLWPVISEDEMDRQMNRFVGLVKLGEGLEDELKQKANQQYVDEHSEPELFAYIQVETSAWLERIDREDTDKFLLLAAWNLVNCIASVPLIESPTSKVE